MLPSANGARGRRRAIEKQKALTEEGSLVVLKER